MCRLLAAIVSLLEKFGLSLKFVSETQFQKLNLNSFETKSDAEILSTICSAVESPSIAFANLPNKVDSNSMYFSLEQTVPATFGDEIGDFMLAFVQKLTVKEEDMSIQEESDAEADSEGEDESSGVTLCRANIQALVKLVLFLSKSNKKWLFFLPQISSTLITNLKSESSQKSVVFGETHKKIISDVLHEICGRLAVFSHSHRDVVSRQMAMVAFSFWDSCKGDGLVHLLSQLRTQNVKRKNLSR